MRGTAAPISQRDEFAGLVKDLQQRIADLERIAQKSSRKPGFVDMFAGTTPPAGWLLCNGASQLRSDYPDLFAAIGTTFGAVDGTHFTLPDYRGRSPIGVGTGAGLTARTLGGTVGAETVTLTAAESGLPAHNHTQNAHNHTQDAHAHNIPRFGTASGSYGGVDSNTATTNNIATANATATNQAATATNQANAAAGASAAHNNMHPTLGVNFVIKT